MANRTDTAKTSFQTAPALLSKKALLGLFGVVDYRTLWAKVLTEEVCRRAGVDRRALQGRSVRTFDALTSQKLKEVLEL